MNFVPAMLKCAIPAFILASLTLLPGCRKNSALADLVDSFEASGVNSATAYSLNPSRNILSDDADEKTALEFRTLVTAEHFHQFPILSSKTTTNKTQIRNLVRSVTRAMREETASYPCFEPRHGIRLSSSASTIDIVICYECDAVEVWDRRKATEPHTAGYAGTSESSKGIVEEFLRSSKP